MRISRNDAERFLPEHLVEARARISAADANNNGNLTKSEATALGSEYGDTYRSYRVKGETVRTNKFIEFYERHATVAVSSGDISGDLANNFIAWRQTSSTNLTDRERISAVWDVMSVFGPVEAGPRLRTERQLPDSVRSWIEDAKAVVLAADDRIDSIYEIYEVPVSSSDSRTAGYAIMGYGDNEDTSLTFNSLHIFSPDGRELDSEFEEYAP